jgi:adenosine deaminase
MSVSSYIQAMPKVELHVHMEGSIRPETLLMLAERNGVELPVQDLDSLQSWYAFRDFGHFLVIYKTIGKCLKTADDIELIARQFLKGQAEQNIRHSEVTYTAYSQYQANRISFEDQLAAINRARDWAADELGVAMTLTVDISRELPAEDGMITADWAISGMGRGVTALGLGGPEIGNPPEKFMAAFERAYEAGLPALPHAGETGGPESIRGALDVLHAVRIGHGVRCLEDADLVEELRERQIPLEVCPTSNICLKVFPAIEAHPLQKLIAEGLCITVNSDDPPMFSTTLTDEYMLLDRVFGMELGMIDQLALNAVRASLIPEGQKNDLEKEFKSEFERLRNEHLE